MILGFKERFKLPILKGTKIHSIRIDANNRWKAGRVIQFATGVRTKSYEQFKTDTCISIQQIEIIRTSDYLNETIVKIDDRILNENEVQQIAYNDGFLNLVEFWLWFSDGFKGKIIHWTNLKY